MFLKTIIAIVLSMATLIFTKPIELPNSELVKFSKTDRPNQYISPSDPEPLVIREASGIVRWQDSMLIVDDSKAGTYFEVDLPPTYRSAPREGEVLRLFVPNKKIRPVEIPHASPVFDLESIAILPGNESAKTELALLSEQSAAVVVTDIDKTKKKPLEALLHYHDSLNEFGGRGLEGLAIRRGKKGKVSVAALWEGGYPEADKLPPGTAKELAMTALSPVIITAKTKGKTQQFDRHRQVTLKVPSTGDWPAIQEFRGTDLVWHKYATKKDGNEKSHWGFIVLLASEHPLDFSSHKPKFKHRFIQRFTRDGHPLGMPIDIDTIMKKAGHDDLAGVANWEGMCWHVKGKSLAICYDKHPKDSPFSIVVLPIPKEWRQTN